MSFAPVGTVGEDKSEADGDGNGGIEGEGRGDVDGDGNGDGEGKSDGDGTGEVVGDGSGEGNGSPTCITVRGASGFRRERMVEGTLGGAIGCGSSPFLTSSRFGRDPSGAPALGLGPLSWARPLKNDFRPPPAIPNGANIAMSKEEQTRAVMDFAILRAARNRFNIWISRS
jgi:hypothetical protein